MFLSVTSFGQNAMTITGKVTDSGGAALTGTNVIVLGTSTGVQTDLNGNYSITVQNPATAMLEFSFIGYAKQQVTVGNQSVVNVILQEEYIGLNELVVVGYGTVRKKDLTGSVSSIKSAEITKTATNNALQSMQGKIAGLDITKSSGESGSGITIALRGNRSINASNTPLFLVDGIEYGSTLDLNASDIQSIEVLKDASSTAIYGTRGANGVVIITTKKGAAAGK
jgi:TonB-dependent SusC/RagA subfamily outer membrane receptor